MRKQNQPRCLLFVVDALSDRIVRSKCDAGSFPNLRRIIEDGGSLHRCLSIFPSITPAATCSIATGCYPRKHHIEGACWYDRERGEIAYFGDDLQFMLERGLRNFFEDFADHLNFQLLDCPTIFQQLHDQEVDSACINFMWFAGPHQHKRATPWLTRMLAGELDERVRGPKYLKLGEFVETLPQGVEEVANRTFLGRYGFKDDCTEEVLMKMASAEALPAFTLAYFPTNDDVSHSQGPSRSADQVLKPFDDFLGNFMEAVGGWDRLGDDLFILIVGDHSQTEFSASGPTPILINKCLSQFKQAMPGNSWESDDEIFICPNMRAAAIYQRDPNDEAVRERIVRRALAEPYIDQAIYENSEGWRFVETGNRGRLAFIKAPTDDESPVSTPGANESNRASDGLQRGIVKDAYGNRWCFEGNLQTIDCHIDADGHLVEGRYPNPLERIDGAFVAGAKPIWLTAGADAEFRLDETSTHSGGSHGALNFEDSESALITSRGISFEGLPNPDKPRIVDVAQLCTDLLSRLRTTPSDSYVYTDHQTGRESVQ